MYKGFQEFVRVTFKVVAEVQYGDTIHLLGDQELGCWKKEDSVPLVTTPDTYPVWETVKPVVVTNEDSLRYRYAIYSGGKFVKFEDAAVRKVVAEFDPEVTAKSEVGDCDMVVSDTFGITKGNELVKTTKNNVSNTSTAINSTDIVLDEGSIDITSMSLQRSNSVIDTPVNVKRVFLVNYNLPVKIRQSSQK